MSKKVKTVLCVDDEADILELLRDELEDNDFNVLDASNGTDGLEVYKNNKVDCIISDIRMPGGNGVELLQNIRSNDNEIPFFLITGYSDHSIDELNGLGVNAVIFKPFDLEEVVEMVKNSLI